MMWWVRCRTKMVTQLGSTGHIFVVLNRDHHTYLTYPPHTHFITLTKRLSRPDISSACLFCLLNKQNRLNLLIFLSLATTRLYITPRRTDPDRTKHSRPQHTRFLHNWQPKRNSWIQTHTHIRLHSTHSPNNSNLDITTRSCVWGPNYPQQ